MTWASIEGKFEVKLRHTGGMFYLSVFEIIRLISTKETSITEIV